MGKREPLPEPGAPLWMCTFGDLMSLLLCFFIMLFAISIIAEIKWEALVETLERRKGYAGTSQRISEDNKPSASLSTTPEESRRTAALAGSRETPGRGGEYVDTQTIRQEGTQVKGGLILFDSGNEELTEKGKTDLEALLPVLSASSYKILVKGHAAPVEIGEDVGIFRRDFYLAYQRAVNVKNHLVSLGLQEEFFQLSTSDSTTIPNRAILSPELQTNTNRARAGASAAVYLLSGTQR